MSRRLWLVALVAFGPMGSCVILSDPQEIGEKASGGTAGANTALGGQSTGGFAGTFGGTGGTTGPNGGKGGTAGRGGTGGTSGVTGLGGRGGAPLGGTGPRGGTGGTAPGDGGMAGEPPDGCGSTRDCMGTFMRRVPRTCDFPPRDPSPVGPPPPGTQHDDECTRDADCGLGSYCVIDTAFGVGADPDESTYSCVAACETDADCPMGEVCDCGSVTMASSFAYGTIGLCRSGCARDAECFGALCVRPARASQTDTNTLGNRDFPLESHCQSPADECWGPQDCPDPKDDPECVTVGECRFIGGRFACDGVCQ